jgi:histidyl-tRNA synthetase
VNFQTVRGMQDLLPEQQAVFSYISSIVGNVLHRYGYAELGMPLLESTGLFKRVVGEATDIVEKEMYSFDDRNGDGLTLRPEGTAGCVRVAQQHGLIFNQIQRLWYSGPMFRYERPQKGRYRQFEQIGAECFGMAGPDIDAELLLMSARIWRELGISDEVKLEINSLGNAESRGEFRQALVKYLEQYKSDLDEDSLRRLESNPLRILDSKVASTQALLTDAPKLKDFIDEESKTHFAELLGMLDAAGLAYTVNPNIVRGLDYYNKTVFEWVTDSLGAQGTVCAGGRYDGLVEQIGGKPSPGVGFAMGLDRLALMLENKFEAAAAADVYVVSTGGEARMMALNVGEMIRNELPEAKVIVHCHSGKFKAQMKKADASNARIAIIIGEDEVACNSVNVKMLRDAGQAQTLVGLDTLVSKLRSAL